MLCVCGLQCRSLICGGILQNLRLRLHSEDPDVEDVCDFIDDAEEVVPLAQGGDKQQGVEQHVRVDHPSI